MVKISALKVKGATRGFRKSSISLSKKKVLAKPGGRKRSKSKLDLLFLFFLLEFKRSNTFLLLEK